MNKKINDIPISLCELLYNGLGYSAVIHDGVVTGFIKENKEEN